MYNSAHTFYSYLDDVCIICEAWRCITSSLFETHLCSVWRCYAYSDVYAFLFVCVMFRCCSFCFPEIRKSYTIAHINKNVVLEAWGYVDHARRVPILIPPPGRWQKTVDIPTGGPGFRVDLKLQFWTPNGDTAGGQRRPRWQDGYLSVWTVSRERRGAAKIRFREGSRKLT